MMTDDGDGDNIKTVDIKDNEGGEAVDDCLGNNCVGEVDGDCVDNSDGFIVDDSVGDSDDKRDDYDDKEPQVSRASERLFQVAAFVLFPQHCFVFWIIMIIIIIIIIIIMINTVNDHRSDDCHIDGL